MAPTRSPHLVLLLVASGCASSASSRLRFPREAALAAPPRGTVLVVLSSAQRQPLADGSSRASGTFLNELFEPWRALTAAGYGVTFATPRGLPPALDPEGLQPKYWKTPGDLAEARALVDKLTPRVLAEVRADDYQAILVPGGQGVMVDLLDDAELHALLGAFARTSRPIGLVCHAPFILTRLTSLSGRHVTGVTPFEEWFIETFVMGQRAQVRGLSAGLDAAGHHYRGAFPGTAHATRWRASSCGASRRATTRSSSAERSCCGW